jgi:peptidyl-prolyl cis-trans isomerase D
MFDFVHEKKRVVQFVLVLIILPFAFWGVDSYRKSGSGESLATVNGEKIGPQEFDNAVRQQEQRMREMAGASFDPTIFEKPEVKHSIMESLVAQHLLGMDAHKVGLTITDEQLADVIGSIGAFQKDGKFDKKQYETVLGAQNMSPLTFEAKVRQELSSRQLTDAYTQNGYASNLVVDNLIRLNEQQRVVSLVKFDVEALTKQVNVEETAINDYYKKNASEFKTPERAKVEYVVFSAETLMPQIVVDEAEISKYYDEHQAEFGTQEQRQASHILITVSAQAPDADKKAAKEKAMQVLQKLKQAPESFAALAKQYSQDPGSANNGGDLGMFGRGAMVKPFEEAVYKLKVGEMTDLVQTDFGYHIIRLTAIKPGKNQSLGEVKGFISQRMKIQKASDKFAELAEKFSNTVYEQSDSLKPAAELVKMPVQQGGWLNKGPATGGVWTDKAIQAVFSDEVIKNKRNTTAVEVAPNTLMAARVVEYQAASVRPLSDVTAGIRQKLQHQQALDLVAKQGGEMLTHLQKGEKTNVNWQPSQTITRGQHPGLDTELTQLVFQLNSSKLPAYVGIPVAMNGYALVRVDEVKEAAAIDDNKRNRYLQQIRQVTGEEMLRSYLADAQKHADIVIKPFIAEEKK